MLIDFELAFHGHPSLYLPLPSFSCLVSLCLSLSESISVCLVSGLTIQHDVVGINPSSRESCHEFWGANVSKVLNISAVVETGSANCSVDIPAFPARCYSPQQITCCFQSLCLLGCQRRDCKTSSVSHCRMPQHVIYHTFVS